MEQSWHACFDNGSDVINDVVCWNSLLQARRYYSLWQNLNFISSISNIKLVSTGLRWFSFFSAASYTMCPTRTPYFQMSQTMTDFSLPEMPKVGGNHFEFALVCLMAWNFHDAVGEKKIYENLIMNHTPVVDRMTSDWEQNHRWVLRKALPCIKEEMQFNLTRFPSNALKAQQRLTTDMSVCRECPWTRRFILILLKICLFGQPKRSSRWIIF